MVPTTSDCRHHPVVGVLCATVGQRRVYKQYAVFAVTLLCTTLASLCSASRLLHCLYYMIYWCVVFGVCCVSVCRVYPTGRLWLTS